MLWYWFWGNVCTVGEDEDVEVLPFIIGRESDVGPSVEANGHPL